MSWPWDADDLRRWAQLQKACATVLRQARERGQPYRGAVRDMVAALKCATKARFPTREQSEIAILRQWLALISGYVASGAELRGRDIEALERASALAGCVLGLTTAPVELESPQRRLPYRDD